MEGLDRKAASILGLRVHAVDMTGAVHCVREMVTRGGAHQVVTLNAEMAMLAQRNRQLAEVINHADLVVADGAGIVWASRMLGHPLPGRVAGLDLMVELLRCAEREAWPVFLLGAAPGVADEAASRLRGTHPGIAIAGTHHGFFSEADSRGIAEKVRASGARLVFVAMGSPRQDTWIARNRLNLPSSVCLGVGGSLDVLAGRVRRAPRWAGDAGIEWLYRLVREPRRLPRMLALPRFVARVLVARYVKPGVEDSS